MLLRCSSKLGHLDVVKRALEQLIPVLSSIRRLEDDRKSKSRKPGKGAGSAAPAPDLMTLESARTSLGKVVMRVERLKNGEHEHLKKVRSVLVRLLG